MDITINNTQQVVLTAHPIDASGAPAILDTVPTWTSVNPTLVSVTPAADGLSAVVKALGPIGTGQIYVEAMSGGVALRTIVGVSVINAHPATVIDVTAGTPT